ncbi:hypothetical protein [Vibrio hepatarius]|uniref:hypothetical protein n=1 Tax=Vibrio hepatarius TaxID=171383 RepID=UPI001C08BB39|nr:hypothetical protein [Vibrio hepatarius]
MDIVVIGTGGLAREFSSFFSKEVNIVGFSSTNSNEFEDFSLCGEFFGSNITTDIVCTIHAVLAIGSPNAKRSVSEKLKNLGFEFPNIVYSSAVSATNLVDCNTEGAITSPNCVIGSNVDFSNHAYLNFMVGVGHDTQFESYLQVNPGVQIGGVVSVGEGVIIGSGSVVLSPVREGITVIGNPAKRLKIPSFDE